MLMHGAGAGVERIGGIGQSPKGVESMFVCHRDLSIDNSRRKERAGRRARGSTLGCLLINSSTGNRSLNLSNQMSQTLS
jgi:hypothetical protein